MTLHVFPALTRCRTSVPSESDRSQLCVGQRLGSRELRERTLGSRGAEQRVSRERR